ncbi:papilin [Halyomorpha halys]|uniref:papilin n=1 Tax=Halyomorpha halys TaxID=286706 RepID=UPI0006D4D652|nr:uncharacterized protein LOC106682324 [Halyomorpha halys]XP_014278603.1 uncharacterized protein LOC106682324 [Halyomorpha halys]XP_024219124.1 uncharacterized protein LOC106682324 [Halyomorpha halys]
MLTWWLLVALCAAGAAACPQHCSCFTDPDGYNSANCSTLALGAVQPSNLDLLSFQPHEPGYPTKLAPRAFLAFKRVKFLWVVNCSVLNLPNEVFQGLDYVIKMDLSYNKIRHLNGGVFKPLGSLHILLLRGNPLLLTPWDVIVSDSLQELDLGHCGLRTIPQGTFISVPRLSRLYLDGNEIHTFTFNMIPAGLRYLNLARNRIVNVPTDVLTTMSYLRKLDLSKNPVNCNCNLVIMQDWFSGQGIIFENGVTCSEPALYAGQHLNKINENELCTLEEVKRQRRINDIENYRDSKSHRTHNMIHDPDLQSDQPGGELYTEVLFDNEGTRGLGTHMELSKHYPLPSDMSDENNKVAANKHELTPTHPVMPTQYENLVEKVMKEVDSGEVSISNNTDVSDEISTEDLSLVNHESSLKKLTAESLTKIDHTDHVANMAINVTSHPSNDSLHLKESVATDSPENEMADEGYSPLYSSTPPSHKEYTEFNKEHQTVADGLSFDLPEDDPFVDSPMADEGYSSVSHMNTSEDEEVGSGDDALEVHSVSQTPVPDKNDSTTPASFTWQSSHADSGDYAYEAQHDYSSEIETTTRSMDVHDLTDTDEGSGSAELDVLSSSSLAPYINEENETSTENYLILDNSTNIQTSSETSTEIIASSSPSYTTLPEITNSPTEDSTTSEPTEESTSELSTEGTTIAIIFSSSESSNVPSSSEPSASSSESIITTELPLSSSSEPAVVITTEISISSTEPPVSSSSEGPIIPFVELEMPTTQESIKETTPAPEVTHIPESTTVPPISEVEVISRPNKQDQKEQIMIEPTQAEREEGRTESAQPTLNYMIAGLIVVLIVIIITTIICKKVFNTGPCTSKKKVRLPQDTEAHLATEMQDMLLPKPPENGVKIIPQNGTQNGKEVKEEEIPVLQKDWDEKPEPIETVTARMSVIAGPQTPVFIHKSLA